MSAAAFTYVYCIAEAGVARALGGLDGIEPGRPPYAIEARGLAAVASDVPADEYAEQRLKERLPDLAWAGEKGLAHERVVETCTLAGPAIPLRFCTIFEDRARVTSLLERWEPRLREILAELGGRAEWGLRGYVDRARFDAWAAAHAAAAAPAAGRAGGAGRAYLQAKKAGLEAHKASGEALSRALAEIYEFHAGAAIRAVRQPVGEAGDLALKAAFLVPLAGRDAFEASAAEERARREAQGIRLHVTGPWPPYAFVPPLESEEARA